jgi:hypothetical protein
MDTPSSQEWQPFGGDSFLEEGFRYDGQPWDVTSPALLAPAEPPHPPVLVHTPPTFTLDVKLTSARIL